MPSPLRSDSGLYPQSSVDVTMDFPVALRAVIDGKKITKLEWGNDYIYGVLKDGFLMLHKTDDEFHQWIISDGDMLGTDWTIVFNF